MFDWSIAARADAHCEELLRTARDERLSRVGREAGRRLLCSVLAWAGDRLLAAGAQLQHRYSVPTSPVPLRS